MPFPSEYRFTATSKSPENIAERLDSIFESLELRWRYKPNLSTGIGFAPQSRSARRQKNKEPTTSRGTTGTADEDAMDDDEDEAEPALGFKIQLAPVEEGTGTAITVRWLQGNDSVLFESFCGMMKRRLTST